MSTCFWAVPARVILVLTLFMSACGPVTAHPTTMDTSTSAVPVVTLTQMPALPRVSPTASPPLAWPTGTPFPNEVTFEIIGQLGGTTRAIAVKDKVVYLGVGPQVLILDVSDPAMPRQIGQSGAFLDFVQDIVIIDDLVYVAAGSAGLHIMDLTEPLRPREIGVVSSDGSFEKVIIRNDTAFINETLGEYFSTYQDVVRFFDVSNPGNPQELNKLDGWLLDVQEEQAYLIQDKVLKVVDISDPHASLKIINTGLKNVSTVAGQYAYTIDVMDSVFGIVDLSDPGNPQPRGMLNFTGDILGRLEGVITINADLIYIKDTFWGESGFISSYLLLIDVSAPDAPQHVSSWSGKDEPSEHGSIFGAPADEVLEDGLLYLALGSEYVSNGFWIVDVHDPINLRKLGSFSALSAVLNAVNVDKSAYVLRFGFPNHLEAIDLANLNNIQRQGIVNGSSSSHEMPLKDHYLYLPGSQGTILDLANSTGPLQVNRTESGLEDSSNIKIAGDHACVSNPNGGLDFLDVSDPVYPHRISHLDTENISHLVCADTEAFYIIPHYNKIDGVTSLHIVDISDITRPVEVFSQTLSVEHLNDVAYNDGYLYILTSSGYVPAYHEQLLVFDVSDRTHPRQVNTVEVGSHFSRIKILGHYLYLLNEDITIFDISDPVHPRPIGKAEIPGDAWYISALNQNTLLVTAGGGILILRIYGLE